MFNQDQINDAAKALSADPALPHGLEQRIQSLYTRARKYSPRWSELDSQLATVMGHAHAADGPTKLLVLQAGERFFENAVIEEEAARKREHQAAVQGKIDAQLWERNRAAQFHRAEKWAASTRAALLALRQRLDESEKRLGASASEAEFRDGLTLIADALNSAKVTIGLEAKESVRREAAEAARLAA